MLTSCRWTMAYVGFLGFVVLYALRVNMSLAVVCMVKPTNHSTEDLNASSSTLSEVKFSYSTPNIVIPFFSVTISLYATHRKVEKSNGIRLHKDGY